MVTLGKSAVDVRRIYRCGPRGSNSPCRSRGEGFTGPLRHQLQTRLVERVDARLERIELPPTGLEAVVLPLHQRRLVGAAGLEPATSGTQNRHSGQPSYTP